MTMRLNRRSFLATSAASGALAFVGPKGLRAETGGMLRFGLSASVFTNDMWKIDRAVHELRAGLIKVNGPTTGSEIHAPFGGEKNSSGHAAREQGDTAQEFFTRTRTTYIKPGSPH